jgi:hypothetical protein
MRFIAFRVRFNLSLTFKVSLLFALPFSSPIDFITMAIKSFLNSYSYPTGNQVP